MAVLNVSNKSAVTFNGTALTKIVFNGTTVWTEPEPPVDQGDAELRAMIAQASLNYIGLPYVYGGASLSTGCDTPGFIYALFMSFGISLPRAITAQIAAGWNVPYDSRTPGDVIFYGSGTPSVAGIYIGTGNIIACRQGAGVTMSAELTTLPRLAIRRYT